MICKHHLLPSFLCWPKRPYFYGFLYEVFPNQKFCNCLHLHHKRLECAKNRDQSCSLIDVETYIMSLGHVKMLDLDSVQPTSQLVPYRKSRPMIDLRQNSENLKNHGTTKQSLKCTTTNTTTKIILMIICFIVIIFLFLSSYFVLDRLN